MQEKVEVTILQGNTGESNEKEHDMKRTLDYLDAGNLASPTISKVLSLPLWGLCSAVQEVFYS